MPDACRHLTHRAILAQSLGDCCTDARGTVREDQVSVRDDHALDREVAERVERRE